jgi:hypothetical protein
MKLSIALWELCYEKILSLLQKKVYIENSRYILRLATILALIDKAIDIKSISDPSRDLFENRTITFSNEMSLIIDDILPRSGEEEENEEEDCEGEQ